MSRHYCMWDATSLRFVLQGKELHCGDCFQVKIGGDWKDVRIEMAGQRWYLHGVPPGSTTQPHFYEARLYPEDVR